ncbi:hypothetical protein ACIBL8_30990 [Streptomyces sp. NPDC050523]|uniref:hypothetical protein n=1 Tax=Streptomyces sp. NPDC050523 TaxID=3365622 RepID=UPI0037A2BB2B
MVINGTEPWPERAHRAGEVYRNGRVYELRYQISITAPPDLVAQADEVVHGIRDLVEDLAAGETYSDWADLRRADLGWFDAFDTMRARMRLDLHDASHPLPRPSPEPTVQTSLRSCSTLLWPESGPGIPRARRKQRRPRGAASVQPKGR